MKWYLIDDDLDDSQDLAEHLSSLGVKKENIFIFIPREQCEFTATKIATNVKPSIDCKGDFYSFSPDTQESGVKIYEDILCRNAEDKFIFLIDLDFTGYSFCGFDILHLFRLSLEPTRYTVRLISNMPRKFMYQFIKKEYENRMSVFGDGQDWVFLSKDASLKLTKNQLEQFLNFGNGDTESEESNHKLDVVLLSQKEITEITIGSKVQSVRQVRGIKYFESSIQDVKPKSVIVDLDFQSPLEIIHEIQRISLSINPFEIKGFGVYFITGKTEAEIQAEEFWNSINCNWKTLLHTGIKSKIEINVNQIVSPIYWKYQMAIELNYERKAIHDIRNAIKKDQITKMSELESIRKEIERRNRLSMDVELQKLLSLIDTKSINLSLSDLDDTLEKIHWILVGDDSRLIEKGQKQLNDNVNILKKYGFLNAYDSIGSYQIGTPGGITSFFSHDNLVFLFLDLKDNSFTDIRRLIAKEMKSNVSKHVTSRFLLCSEHTKIDKTLKQAENKKCIGGFVYNCLTDKDEILTIDRVSFIRQNLRNVSVSNLNSQLHQLITKDSSGIFSIDKDQPLINGILGGIGDNLLDIGWGTNNTCPEEYNTSFLKNRICILDYICKNLCLVTKWPNNSINPFESGDIETIGNGKYFIVKDRVIRAMISIKHFNNLIQKVDYEVLANDGAFAELIKERRIHYKRKFEDRNNGLLYFIANVNWFIFAVLNENIKRKFIKEHSNMSPRDFLHGKYAFDVVQSSDSKRSSECYNEGEMEEEERMEELLIAIKPSSLFEYEKDYLRKKYAANDIVQAWLNS